MRFIKSTPHGFALLAFVACDRLVIAIWGKCHQHSSLQAKLLRNYNNTSAVTWGCWCSLGVIYTNRGHTGRLDKKKNKENSGLGKYSGYGMEFILWCRKEWASIANHTSVWLITYFPVFHWKEPSVHYDKMLMQILLVPNFPQRNI